MTSAVDREAIQDASARLVEAVNASDVDGVMTVWSDDGVIMPPHHPAVRGRRAIEHYFRELFQRARFRFVFTEAVITIGGDMATERIAYTAEMWPAGSNNSVTDLGKGLHVFVRDASGIWKLAADVWNSDSPRT
jgi:uncharacterized protein (TIGR02246 family)